MKEIPLTKGQVALVDDEDYESISCFTWQARFSGDRPYAQRNLRPGSRARKGMKISMHRQILCLTPDDKRIVDHINRNSVDNRRSNLRIVTHRENAWNRTKSSRGNNYYKGVSKCTYQKMWMARIAAAGKRFYLGRFTSPEKAHAAYCEASKSLHGEYARFV